MGLILNKRTQLVELIVPSAQSGATKFNFPDQPQINRDGMVIDYIESLCVTDVTYTPSQVPVITEAMMEFSFFTGYVSMSANTDIGQGEQINQYPLTLMHRAQGSATTSFVRDMFGLPALRMDWSKSYITTGQPLGNGAAIAFLFNVGYHQVSTGLKRR